MKFQDSTTSHNSFFQTKNRNPTQENDWLLTLLEVGKQNSNDNQDKTGHNEIHDTPDDCKNNNKIIIIIIIITILDTLWW